MTCQQPVDLVCHVAVRSRGVREPVVHAQQIEEAADFVSVGHSDGRHAEAESENCPVVSRRDAAGRLSQRFLCERTATNLLRMIWPFRPYPSRQANAQVEVCAVTERHPAQAQSAFYPNAGRRKPDRLEVIRAVVARDDSHCVVSGGAPAEWNAPGRDTIVQDWVETHMDLRA